MSRRDRQSALDAQVEALYRETGPAVLGYLTRRTAAPEHAADLFSEVLVVLCRRRDQLPPPGEDRLWLFGIARNVLANDQRRAVRHREVSTALAAHLRATVTEPADPDQALDLRAALDNLPPLDREIVQLSTWEELTSSEVGALLDMPAETVRTRLRRTRTRLRHDLNLIDDQNGRGHPQPEPEPTPPSDALTATRRQTC